ncbi:S-layer homology domain-containing protein [Peptoniphilus raoultii]|uniref:S-layer homology domain-containing protein n=1 Tax=Peptoniphilus raoultii TaxID=1776387 RepID=UPI0008D9128D|nr:S-layer homology domain-containing protein [Peptoniphilus raoultii]
MNKKFAAGILTLAMISSTVTSTFAFNFPKLGKANDNAQKVEELRKINIVSGYADGSLGLDKNLTRSELTKLVVYAIGEDKKAAELKDKESTFKDVKKEYWANGIINTAVNLKNEKGLSLISGYPDMTFKGDSNITYAELVKILDVLKNPSVDEAKVKEMKWPDSWIKMGDDLKITGKDLGVEIKDYSKDAIRSDAFVMIYNAIVSDAKVEEKKDQKSEEIKIEDVKAGVKSFVELLEKGNVVSDLEKVSSKDGFEARIPTSELALKDLKAGIERAKILVDKKDLSPAEEKELRDLLPKVHEKKDLLTGGLAKLATNFAVDWNTQVNRDFKASHGKDYTKLTDNKIVIKSKAASLDQGKIAVMLNAVKDSDYKDSSLDLKTGATPKYKKFKVDPKYYEVSKTDDGYVINLKTNEAGYEEAMKDVRILKPVVHYVLGEQKAVRDGKDIVAKVLIENGDLVFIPEK